MELKEAIKIVKEQQKWRRSESPYDGDSIDDYKPMPYSPKVFGEAIDTIIHFTEETIEKDDFLTVLRMNEK